LNISQIAVYILDTLRFREGQRILFTLGSLESAWTSYQR